MTSRLRAVSHGGVFVQAALTALLMVPAQGEASGTKLLVLPYQPIYRSVAQTKAKKRQSF